MKTPKDEILLQLLQEIVSIVDDLPGQPQGMAEHLQSLLYDLEIQMKIPYQPMKEE